VRCQPTVTTKQEELNMDAAVLKENENGGDDDADD
jgi:hypothetical protein